jgi:TPR repeat protein
VDSAYDAEVVVKGARENFRGAAEAGDGRAMFELGVLEERLGDVEEAKGWFRRAAEAGETEAAGRLGRLLVWVGAERDAEPFLETAAEAGDHEAAVMLGTLLRDRSLRWLRAGAEGHAPRSEDGYETGEGADLTTSLRVRQVVSEEFTAWFLRTFGAGRPGVQPTVDEAPATPDTVNK